MARVVIGSRDPNPLVAGKGAEILRLHGIQVEEDFLREECDALNPAFFHYITTGRPYVVMKYAMTLDGKIAAYTGASQWITGEAARTHVHSLRGKYSTIMAGIGTVLADDPMLNSRLEGAHQPIRVIVDSHLRIPLDSRICQTARELKTIVACAQRDEDKMQALEQLGKDKLDSVLIEGGSKVHEAALQAGIVNHVCAYIALKLLGGAGANTPMEGRGAAHPDQAAQLDNLKITQLGAGLLLEYDLREGLNHVYWNR